MNNTIFGDPTLCSLVDGHPHSGGMYCFHLHGRKLNQARKPGRSRWQAEPAGLKMEAVFSCKI
jgi:hypothetical protein